MSRRCIVRSLSAALLGLGLHAGIASAWQITLTPVAPTPVDPIHVVVQEGFPGGLCWRVDSRTCTFAAPDSVLVTANIQFCNGSPLGCFCTAQPVSFEVTCDFSPLPPGDYRVVYRERYLNPIDDRDTPPRELLFTVSATTPALRRSWGRLKAIYR